MNNNLKAVAYLRTATSTQKIRSLNLQNQKLKIERYAKKHDITVVNTFKHIGYGYGHFVNIYEYCKRNKIKTILVTHQDIISRSYEMALHTVYVFDKYGIEIIPVEMIENKNFKQTLWYVYRFAKETNLSGDELLEALDTKSHRGPLPF